ncbi:Histidine triad nucleotide-binding protein 3 [Eumeta japonica]|uniref:Adenosine 5'-monophosphoramidase HINT3 n=1 Tax=Eumeta variegata TaxID=151549 RepID=A0A4C1TJU1_EUMVA|nr:Histidine triad nucleotide-binding protein 3 [Eumeta japonica]
MDLNKNLKQAMKNSAKGSVGDSKIIRLNEKLSVEESNECMPNPNGLLGLDDFKQDSRGKHNFAIEFAHSSGISTSENELAITDVIIAERDKLNDNKPSLNTAKTVESNDVVVNEGVILAKELILGRVHKSARDKILERLVIQTKQNTSPSSPKNATDEVTISRHDIHADSHFLSDSNCVILNCRHSDVLVTCKAWNCIKEKYAFCNVCQVNLQTGVEEHCAELTHETKLVESVCEWSEGAFMREQEPRIHCLICDVVFGRFLLEVHIKSILHSKNFKKTKALAEDMMKRIPNGTENAPSETRENIATEVKNTIFMVVPFKSLTEEFEPQNAQKSNRIVLVKHLEACADVDGRKTDEYFLLEFDTERILLTYNCWNSVTENRNCCLLCSSELLESVAEHCNGYVHSMNIKRKIVTHNFLRLINSTKTYCFICNEVSSPTEMEEHLKTGLHKKNLKRARTQAVKNQNGGYKPIKYGELLKEQFCARKRIQNKVRAINIARRMSNLYVEDILEYDTLEWDELPPYKCDRRHKRIRQVYGIHKSASLQIQTDGQLISRNENLSVVSPKKPWGNINWFQYAYCSLCKDNVDFNEIDSHCKSEMHEQKRKYNLKKSGKKKIEKSNGSSIVVTKLENASDERNAQLADKRIPLATKRQKGHIYPKLTTNLDRKMDGTCRALLNEEVNTMNKAKSKDNIVEEVINDCYDAIEKGIEAGVKTRICNDSATDGEKNEKILKKYFKEIAMDMSYPETDAAAAKSLLKGYSENTSNAFMEEQEHEASVKVRTKGWVTLQLGGRAMTITSHSYHGVYLRSLNTMGCVLCGVLKVPNEHILSKQHLNRLNSLKFKGVHLIRYLSKSSVHCAPCHRIVAVATLKDHFHSEDHERNVILASEVPGAVVLEEDCGESEISKSNECIKSEASVVQDVPFENDDVASQHVGLTVNSRTSPHTQIYSSSSMSESESTSYHRNTSIENIEHLQPRLANFEDHADANETEPVANIALICNVCNVYIPTFQQKLIHSLSSQHIANFRAFRSSSASQTVIADSIFTQIDKCHEKTRSLASIATPLPDSAATYTAVFEMVLLVTDSGGYSINISERDSTKVLYKWYSRKMAGNVCIFCNIVNKIGDTEILYEDDDVCVFRDIKPASRFHVLVIPKTHIEDVKHLTPDDKELVQKMLTIAKDMLSKNNFSISNARFGYHWPPFRSVKHLHLHAIAPESEMGYIAKMIFMKNSYCMFKYLFELSCDGDYHWTVFILWKKHLILKNKPNLPQDVNIKEDYPKEILDKRKQLQPQVEEEIKKGNIAYIKYDKLIVKKPKENREKRKRETSDSPKAPSEKKNNKKATREQSITHTTQNRY